MTRRAEGLRKEDQPGDLSPGPLGRSFILTVNGGSSSLKFALFDRADPPARRASGRIERIGLAGTRLAATGLGGTVREAGHQRADYPVRRSAGCAITACPASADTGGEAPGEDGHQLLAAGVRLPTMKSTTVYFTSAAGQGGGVLGGESPGERRA